MPYILLITATTSKIWTSRSWNCSNHRSHNVFFGMEGKIFFPYLISLAFTSSGLNPREACWIRSIPPGISSSCSWFPKVVVPGGKEGGTSKSSMDGISLCWTERLDNSTLSVGFSSGPHTKQEGFVLEEGTNAVTKNDVSFVRNVARTRVRQRVDGTMGCLIFTVVCNGWKVGLLEKRLLDWSSHFVFWNNLESVSRKRVNLSKKIGQMRGFWNVY